MIGGGPAGLMAAEVLAAAGATVVVWERMPTVGRKLLIAGRGGANLTHSEGSTSFMAKYGSAAARIGGAVEAFPPAALIAWVGALGQATFVGSSGRVFPVAMKASPLLRAWRGRLAGQGVTFRMRCLWEGWDGGGALVMRDPDGSVSTSRPDATVLALGGASWPRLGSDGRWAPALQARGIGVAPFRPSNCGFRVTWSEAFRARFAGSAMKGVGLEFRGRRARGEAIIAAYGIEGGPVYALSAALRDAVASEGPVTLSIDLAPDLTLEGLERRLASGNRAGASTATRLRRAGLDATAANLLREGGGPRLPEGEAALARAIKAVPVRLTAPEGLDRAISSAGGVRWDEVADDFSLHRLPDVFVAGEMLDWEATTGGYLLQAAFSTGVAAGRGAAARLGLA